MKQENYTFLESYIEKIDHQLEGEVLERVEGYAEIHVADGNSLAGNGKREEAKRG